MNNYASRASRIANSINSANAFIEPNARVVQLPNGTVMLASQVENVPEKYLNLTRFKNNLANFPSNRLNSIRNNNWRRASRAEIIEFIMSAYYSYFHSTATEDIIPIFHRAISKLTSRERSNKNMIPARNLYRLLIKLNTETLLKLAHIVEW